MSVIEGALLGAILAVGFGVAQAIRRGRRGCVTEDQDGLIEEWRRFQELDAGEREARQASMNQDERRRLREAEILFHEKGVKP